MMLVEYARFVTLFTKALIEMLQQESSLTQVRLSSEAYRDELRYAWRTASPFEMALSLRANAYLCHATAAYLHGLTEERHGEE